MTERATKPRPWTFDPVTLGRRECDAWAAHYRHEWPQFLTAAVGMISTGFGMNALYSYVYDVSADLTRPASALRVKAMDLSDRWVEAGCNRADRLLAEERRTLVAAYAALRDATARQPGPG
jgi:hypothetical protein